MALDLRQNFVSTQYLRTNWQNFTKFYICILIDKISLELLHIIFHLFVPELWPLIYAKFCFHSISWEQMDRISPNFIYAFILTRSTLGLLHIIFAYGPWFRPKFPFWFNILRKNGQNFTIFYICIYIDNIYIGIVTQHFSHICTRVMALDLRRNSVSVQYLEKKWTEFHQILSIQSYRQSLCRDCYTSFYAHFYTPTL